MNSLPRNTKWSWSALLCLILLSSSGTSTATASDTKNKGAVASESKVCSEIGIGLLKRGGNAADAMVGTTLCVGVIGMQHSGIGGGGFMLVRGSDGKYESIDFRETAPEAAFENMYKDNIIGSVRSGLASGVPGDVRGLEYLHSKYGKLPWRAVCNPAVHVARYGFPVTEDLVRYMDAATSDGNTFLTDDPQWAIDFAPNGTRVGLGDILTRKRYANTLESIAKHGSKAFYSGPIANSTITALQSQNGTMTLSDLLNYKVITRKPISITYRGYRIHSCGAPSGGSVALNILKTIEGYNMSDASISPLNTHRLDEAMRFAYALRTSLGDPDFFPDMNSLVSSMLSSSTACSTRNRITNTTHQPSYYFPPTTEPNHFYTQPENHGTSHIVTSDATGMSISLTSTVNLLFGSQLIVPETGIIMNNEMNDFSIPGTRNAFGFVPSPINYIRPFKRPLSSISPLIVEHGCGTLYLTIGAAGGSRIPTATVQGVWHVLDHGMGLAEALAERRLHDQLVPAETTFEVGFEESVVGDMRERGHNVSWVGYQTAVQATRWLGEEGGFEAVGEPRQRNSGGLIC